MSDVKGTKLEMITVPMVVLMVDNQGGNLLFLLPVLGLLQFLFYVPFSFLLTTFAFLNLHTERLVSDCSQDGPLCLRLRRHEEVGRATAWASGAWPCLSLDFSQC